MLSLPQGFCYVNYSRRIQPSFPPPFPKSRTLMRFRSLLVITLAVLTANSQIALAAGDSPQNAGDQFAKMFGSWKILLAKAVQL